LKEVVIKNVEIWCDGSAIKAPNNQYYCGAGTVLIYGNYVKEVSTPIGIGTNNIAELTAPLVGLRLLKERCFVTIYSDSQYTIDCITKYYSGWERRGFVTQNKGEVKNKQLVIDLYNETQKHHVTWVKVKAHTGVEFNERADRLACEASAKSKQVIECGGIS
jgi:ribonuclease HI